MRFSIFIFSIKNHLIKKLKAKTAGTTVLNLVPLCVVSTQIGSYGPPYFPMARAIVGGLTFSTIVTLLILPTIYVLFDDLRNWARRVVSLAK